MLQHESNPPKSCASSFEHAPNLETILMVEKAIKESKSYPTKKALLASLPRQVQYSTFQKILAYLESSNKIAYDGHKIIWIFPDNPKLAQLLKSSVPLWIFLSISHSSIIFLVGRENPQDYHSPSITIRDDGIG